MARKAPKVRKAHKVTLVPPLPCPDRKARKALTVLMVHKARKVALVLPVVRVQPARKDHRATRVLRLPYRGYKATRGLLARKVPAVWWVRKVWWVRRAMRVLPVRRVCVAPKVIKVTRGLRVHKAHKVTQAHRVLQAHRVQQVLTVTFLARKVQQALKG